MQELQPGLELALAADKNPQEAKQAERFERRKLYPIPPDAATNFRPAVGKELVEHALQISAAKRAKASQAVAPQHASENETAHRLQAEGASIGSTGRRHSADERVAGSRKPTDQGVAVSNPSTSLQLGSSREALRLPARELAKASEADRSAERKVPALADERGADSAVGDLSGEGQTKSPAKDDGVSEVQKVDEAMRHEAEGEPAQSDSIRATGGIGQAKADGKETEDARKQKTAASELHEASAVPTPEQRRDKALKVHQMRFI